MSSFIRIRPWEAELFHADGRTDRTNLIDAFRNFANASKNNEDGYTLSQPTQRENIYVCVLYQQFTQRRYRQKVKI